jgi:hypothetical protein
VSANIPALPIAGFDRGFSHFGLFYLGTDAVKAQPCLQNGGELFP